MANFYNVLEIRQLLTFKINPCSLLFGCKFPCLFIFLGILNLPNFYHCDLFFFLPVTHMYLHIYHSSWQCLNTAGVNNVSGRKVEF